MLDSVFDDGTHSQQDGDILGDLDLLDNSLFNFNFNFNFNQRFFSSNQVRDNDNGNSTGGRGPSTAPIKQEEDIIPSNNFSFSTNATSCKPYSPQTSRTSGYFESYIAEHMVFGGSRESGYTSGVPQLQHASLELNKLLDCDARLLPHRLTIEGLPVATRVENQMNLKLTIAPSLDEAMLYLPTNCIARQKFYLNEQLSQFPEDFENNLLFLHVFLLKDTTMKPVEVCMKCVRREQKRASRRKSGLSDNLTWCNDPNRSAVVFTTKQLFAIDGRSFKLITRILCYCRHHNSPSGFRLLFAITDSKAELLAKSLTAPILITDKKQQVSVVGGSPNDIKASTGFGPLTLKPSDSLTHSSLAKTVTPDNFSLDPTNLCANNRVPHIPALNSYSEDNSDSMTNSSIQVYHGYSSSTSTTGPILDSACGSSVLENNGKRLHLDPFIDCVVPVVSKPRLEHINPTKGPVVGGTEVILLGSNFKEGLTVKFGENVALAVHCWSDSTIVALLPPAAAPSPVPVTITEPSQGINGSTTGPSNDNNSLDSAYHAHGTTADFFNMNVFTYVDDTDRQLIELALQIVGLQMNGRLEDPKSIATKIVCNNNNDTGNTSGRADSRTGSNSSNHASLSVVNSNVIQSLDYGSGGGDTSSLVIKIIKALAGTQSPNLSICDPLGRRLLHLAAYAGYFNLVSTLIKTGAHVEAEDKFGYTPLHFAAINGDYRTIRLLISCHSSPELEGPKSLFIAYNRGRLGESENYRNILKLFEAGNNGLLPHLARVDSDTSMFADEYQYSTDTAPKTTFPTDQKLHDICAEYMCIAQGSVDLADISDNNSSDSEWETNETAPVLPGPLQVTQDQKWQPDVPSTNSEEPQDRVQIQQGRRQSVWHMVNRFINKLNDELPRYEDLFPSFTNANVAEKAADLTASEATIKPETSPWGVTSKSPIPHYSSGEGETIDSEDDEITKKKFHSLFRKDRIHLKNDRMLLLFWLPIAVLIVSWTLFINLNGSDTQSALLKFLKVVENYLFTGAAKFVLGKNRIKEVWLEKQSQLLRAGAA